MKLPTFEEMLEKANLQLPVPPEKSVIAAAKFAPGEFPTDTGRINFYSPWLAQRGRVQAGVARAQYVRPADGSRKRLMLRVVAIRCSTRRRICPIVRIRPLTTRR